MYYKILIIYFACQLIVGKIMIHDGYQCKDNIKYSNIVHLFRVKTVQNQQFADINISINKEIGPKSKYAATFYTQKQIRLMTIAGSNACAIAYQYFGESLREMQRGLRIIPGCPFKTGIWHGNNVPINANRFPVQTYGKGEFRVVLNATEFGKPLICFEFYMTIE